MVIKNQDCLEKGLTPKKDEPFPLFLWVCGTRFFQNTVGKGEIAGNEQFLLSPIVFSTFLPFWKISAIFIKSKTVFSKVFKFGRV